MSAIDHDRADVEAAEPRRIRAIIADDDAFVRRMLRDVLEQADVTVIGEVANGRDAVELATYYKPDIVLMDMLMPVLDGIDATRALRESAPEVKVIMLTAAHGEESGLLGLQAGAVGFLSKDVELSALPKMLAGALENEAVVSPALTMALIERLRALPPGGRGMRPVKSRLTPREWEVLDLLCDGRSTQEIASELVLAEDTVYSHVKNVLRKLGVRSREEAVAVAEGLRLPGAESV